MIYNMIIIIAKFLILYIIGLITLAAVAMLTLSSNEDFADLFEAIRTYFETSLGSFNLRQYDDLPGWKRFYAMGLHVAVLMLNMLIMVNLLIAILSDEYASLVEVRRGLYWSSVIDEMSKYRYDKYYGTLSMLPFPYSWLSMLSLPCMLLFRDPKKLARLNQLIFAIVFIPISLVVLSIFIAINLILLPFAYLWTLVHKI